MKIESKIVEVQQSSENVFNLLKDFNNYESLFPEEKIKNWKSSEDNCSFMIKGMSNIEMKIKNRQEFDSIHIISGSEAPFKFDINIQIEASKDQENLTAIQLTFEADINPFMKMMVEKPLTNFFNTMVEGVPSKF